jgi:hypothetical protein
MAERLWPGRRVLADHGIAGRGVLTRANLRHRDRIREVRGRVRQLVRPVRAPDTCGSGDGPPLGAGPSAVAPLRVDPTVARLRFDREPFLCEHGLVDHPLLQLPRLIELARTLPEEHVEWNAGEVAIGQVAELTPRTGLGVEETLRQIEERSSWMVLKYVESDPEYARLLDECLDPLVPVLAGVRPGMHRRHAFVFVSSPGAVTPFHVDFEHNFLLQVRGAKTVTVWDGDDRAVMSEEQRERKVGGDQRNLPWRDGYAARGRAVRHAPGDAHQVPLSSPHWVRVGDEVSVSFSVTFMTEAGARLCDRHRANGFWRQHGLRPWPVGRSPITDAVQWQGFRAAKRVSRLRRAIRERAGSGSRP